LRSFTLSSILRKRSRMSSILISTV
jgi:hypothetical protein